MSKEGVSFKNIDRFIQLGIAISTLRKLRGMSQDQLAEKANMSLSLIHISSAKMPSRICLSELPSAMSQPIANATTGRTPWWYTPEIVRIPIKAYVMPADLSLIHI